MQNISLNDCIIKHWNYKCICILAPEKKRELIMKKGELLSLS